MRNHVIVKRAIKKALQSPCRYHVSAIAFDVKGCVLGITANTPNISTKGGGIHAEQKAIGIWGSRIQTLLICRANKSGQLLPIHPCRKCSKLSGKFGITIKTIEDKERFEKYRMLHQNSVQNYNSVV